MRRTIALGLLLGTFSCSSQDPAPTLTGSVFSIHHASESAVYAGEIGVGGTEVGTIRVYISYGMPIHIRSSNTPGDLSSFALGDRVIMHYDENGAILKSGIPVWPITDIVIDK